MKINKLEEYIVNKYTYKNFISLDKKQIKKIWQWRNHPLIRQFMYNSEMIPILEHERFIDSLTERDDIYYWLVCKNDHAIGVASLTNVNHKENIAELGYYMVPDLLNSGIGLDFAFSNFYFAFYIIECNHLTGGIHPQNHNALLIDKYFGCILGSPVKLFKEKDQKYIPWKLSKQIFAKGSINKNNIKEFVLFLKDYDSQ